MAKYLTAMLLVVGSWCTCAAWEMARTDTIETRYPDGQLKEQYVQVFWGGNETTRRTGFYRTWYSSGRMEWEGWYDQDLKTGTWIRWDSTGRRVEEVTFAGGEKHGSEIEWNADGRIRKWLHFRKGRLHGRCTLMKSHYTVSDLYNHPDMTVESDQFYLEGTLVARLETTFDVTGLMPGCALVHASYNSELDVFTEQLSHTHEYHVGKKVEGRREGIWIVWAEDGTMIRQELYEHGQLR